MVTKSINPESPLDLFDFGHTKNVQNPILESLSHTKILHFSKGYILNNQKGAMCEPTTYKRVQKIIK